MHGLSSEVSQHCDEAAAQAATCQLAWHNLQCQPRTGKNPTITAHHKSLSINISIDSLEYQLLLLHCHIEVSVSDLFLEERQGFVATSHDDNQEPYPRPRNALCSYKSSKPPSGDGFYSRSVIDEGVIT
jgi:hypothetical protein